MAPRRARIRMMSRIVPRVMMLPLEANRTRTPTRRPASWFPPRSRSGTSCSGSLHDLGRDDGAAMHHDDGRESMALHSRSLRIGTPESCGNVSCVEAVTCAGRVHDRVEFFERQASARSLVQDPDFLASGLEDGLLGAQM